MNQTPKVGIQVDAKVDRSVGRAFNETEKHIQGATREERKFDRSVGDVNQSVKKQRRVLGGAVQTAKNYSRSVGDATRQNSLLSRSMNKVGEGLDGMLNQWTALAGGVAGVGSAAMTLAFDERVTRLGIQANRSAEEMDSLKQTIFDISQLPDIKADPDQVLAAVEKIVEKTGDLDLAKRNIRNIAMTLQATGAAGMDTGAMVADMAQKFNINADSGLLNSLDTLVMQGKQGAFTLQALAAEGANATAAYAAMGRSGGDAVREMGALLQIGMMGSGSAAEAASAFDSTLNDITANRERFENLGIELFDPEQMAKGKKVWRAIPDILRETMQATGGDITQYSELFGDEAMRLIKVLGNEYQNTGMLKTLDDLLQVQGDGTTILKDSGRAADSAAATYRNLMFVWRDIADSAFSGPLQAIADATNSFDKETLKLLLQVGAAGAVGLGALALGRKVWNVGAGITDFIRGGRSGKAGGAGALGSAAGGVTPVFVTNMGVGGMGGAVGVGKSRSAGRKGLMTRGGSMLRNVGRGALPISLLMGGLSIGSTLMDDDLSGDDKTRQLSRDVGGMGGAAAGALAGAAIGSVVPVVGTAIGGLIGSFVGGLGGEAIGGWLGDRFTSKPDSSYAQAVKSVGTARAAAGNTSITAEIHVKSTDPAAAGAEVREQIQALRSESDRRASLAFGDS